MDRDAASGAEASASLRTIKSLAVFCGSSGGATEVALTAVDDLSAVMADRGIGLVFGGASVGVMGRLADRCVRADLTVIGVIPEALYRDGLPHQGGSRLIVSQDMQSRKRKILELSDAAVALPGGHGTLDELFELLTWNQLGLTSVPAGLLNTHGYFDPLIEQLDRAVEYGFLKMDSRRLLASAADSETLLNSLEHWAGPTEPKWITQ